jgi:ASPM-SPD-2-Hydin domain-containing protein/HYDIN/CFA65/VesB family protein
VKPRKLMLLVGVLPLTMVAQSAVAGTVGHFSGSPDLTFPSRTINSGPSGAQTVTITNTDSVDHTITSVSAGGADGGQFNVDGSACGLVTAGSSCDVSVTFDPTSTGPKSATVDIASDDGSGSVATLSGTGISFLASASPATLGFNSHVINTSTSLPVTLTNTGTEDLTVSGVSILNATAGAGFSATGCVGPLAAGGSCQISVTFNPTAAGSHTATLSISDSATNGPQTVALSGTATAAGVSVPATLDFGNVLPNTTATKTLTITNNGSAPLNVSAISLLGGLPFAVVSGSNCLAGPVAAAGGTCTVQVTYHPTITGGASDTLQIASDAPGSPASVTVTGNSISKFVDISPAIHGFGTLTVGKLGSPVPYTLTNKDVAPLSLGANPIRISGRNSHSFVVTANTCVNRVLAANGTCAFNVRFSPGSAGPLSGVVRELDSAPDSPHGAALTGAAVLPPNATNLHGSAGCTAITMLWTPSGTAGAVGSWITRNAHHVPRSPGDGTRLARTRPGVLLNGRLAEFHTYYYAIWTLYRFQAGHPIVFSARKAIALHTGRMCQPQNGATIRSHTPLLRWLPRRGAFAYGLRIYDRGVNIFAWSKRTTTPRYQVKSSWVFRGTRRSLHSGHTYTVFIYAYTRNLPRGFQIGKSAFHVR